MSNNAAAREKQRLRRKHKRLHDRKHPAPVARLPIRRLTIEELASLEVAAGRLPESCVDAAKELEHASVA